jgi:aldose 1-epimerase
MDFRRTTIGVTAGHSEQPPTHVDEYTLETGSGLCITVWTYGATLVEACVPDARGRRANVVFRLPNLASYEDRVWNEYVGSTVGRYARCIAGGRFALDGIEFELDRNAGPHHIHGGTFGFDRFVWQANADRVGNGLALRLQLERPDGDQGYPGAIAAVTTYLLEAERLTLEHRATTTASTVVALTNHAFWNLRGWGTIDDHRLTVNATHVLPVDADLVPVGAPVAVAGSPLDYTAPRPLAGRTLDHCFALDEPAWAAELADPSSGRAMRIVTDQPGLQVYTGDGLRVPRAGIALQTGAWPDSPNRPDYPSSRLDSGDVYVHRTIHEFSLR